MKTTLCNTVILLLLFLPFMAAAQVVGTTFPIMATETVNDKKITLPTDVQGKFTLVGLAYSKKSEDDLNSWFQPTFEKFIQKSDGLFSGFAYDVNVYFIPMFTGVNAAASGAAKRKAVKNIDPNLLPHILFYRGELKTYKEALDFEKRDIPYFFVLNPEGKIVFATSGKYTSQKMDEVEGHIE
ncbi:MAG TPA: hypothetical protein VD927_09020 [Chryseosolibacter sp.]|nr:hypothetical protein [Chryseosolibacter sp.]